MNNFVVCEAFMLLFQGHWAQIEDRPRSSGTRLAPKSCQKVQLPGGHSALDIQEATEFSDEGTHRITKQRSAGTAPSSLVHHVKSKKVAGRLGLIVAPSGQ